MVLNLKYNRFYMASRNTEQTLRHYLSNIFKFLKELLYNTVINHFHSITFSIYCFKFDNEIALNSALTTFNSIIYNFASCIIRPRYWGRVKPFKRLKLKP